MYSRALIILATGFLVCVMCVGEPTNGRFMKFLRNLLFAPQDLKYSNAVIFDKNQGEVNQEHYKRAYGSQGRVLVEAYGKGLSKKQLEDLGYL